MSRHLSLSSEESAVSILDFQEPDGNASGVTTLKKMPIKSTTKTSRTHKAMTGALQKLMQKTSQTTLYYAAVSHANLFQWLENVKGSKTFVEHSFLRLPEYSKLKDLHYFCLKTSTALEATTTEIHLKPSSERWGTWGIGGSTKCLTANVGYHKIEREYSLLDILEKEVPDRFFLSKKRIQGIIQHMQRHKAKGNGFQPRFIPVTIEEMEPT